jgi:hypothetical protein
VVPLWIAGPAKRELGAPESTKASHLGARQQATSLLDVTFAPSPVVGTDIVPFEKSNRKGRFILMNKKIILSSLLVALFCTLLFGSSSLAHSTVVPSRESPTVPTDTPHVCYDVADAAGTWLPTEECTSQNVVIPGGIYGLGVALQGVSTQKHVHYKVYAGGKWTAEKQDGDKIDTTGPPDVPTAAPITAVRLQLAPRAGWHLGIRVRNSIGIPSIGQDNQVVGDTSATALPLTEIRIFYYHES